MNSGKPRQVVVDDTDPNINYSGKGWSWKVRGAGAPQVSYYNNTLHSTNIPGQFSYTFKGTSVAVFGAVSGTNNHDSKHTFDCSIDGISIASKSASQLLKKGIHTLCEEREMHDGKHELEVRVNSARSSILFDKIHYTPSPGLVPKNAVVLVDNQDPEIVFYPQWKTNNRGIEPSRSTNDVNSKAIFNFTGTAISWFGPASASSSPAATAVYTLDNGKPIPFSVGAPFHNQSTTNFNKELFKISGLEARPHSLVVTYKGGGAEQTPLTLSHLLVTNISIPVEHPQPKGHKVPGAIAPGVISPGIIAGIVIGVILVILALVGFVLWWRERRRRQNEPTAMLERGPPPRYTMTTPDVSSHTYPSSFNDSRRSSSSSTSTGSIIPLFR